MVLRGGDDDSKQYVQIWYDCLMLCVIPGRGSGCVRVAKGVEAVANNTFTVEECQLIWGNRAYIETRLLLIYLVT